MYNEVDVEIGKIIKKYRSNANYSLNDLANKVGKARETIHAYEKGRISIAMSTFIDICNALNINYIEVLEEVNENMKRGSTK